MKDMREMYGRRIPHRKADARQSGYMLLVLMLAVAMLAITLLGVATNYRQSIRRDREVEMIHRGVQYERAVRRYYRKNNNSYPPSIERLLETNKIRYLRKRYKDPMTKDGTWKIAHLTDVNVISAASGLGTPGSSTLDSTSAGGAGSTTAPPQSQQSGTAGSATPASGDAIPGSEKGVGVEPASPSSASSGPSETGVEQPASTSGGAGQVLGGQAMIGVVSKSDHEGIHTFNEKSKYSEWLFIYLPTQDTGKPGHIPNGPFNPKANQTAAIPGQAGSPVLPGQTQGTSAPDVTKPTPSTPVPPMSNP